MMSEGNMSVERGEVPGGWRALQREEVHDAYCLLNISRAIK